ncbi:hypothetical protein AN958_10627 [Leucoagaricus sp. SymC.cos]|nr:hypothetical protein AN958_10627 [Leucoagaricus sp. SymC.cos]
MLYKATGGDIKKWFWNLHHVMWADRNTVRKGTGCFPYFLVTGAHPTIPLDVIEATWLVKYLDRFISMTELVGLRAQTLAKHAAHVEEMCACISTEKIQWTICLEEEIKHKIMSNEVKPGDLVLVKNSSIEKSVDRKMQEFTPNSAGYLGTPNALANAPSPQEDDHEINSVGQLQKFCETTQYQDVDDNMPLPPSLPLPLQHLVVDGEDSEEEGGGWDTLVVFIVDDPDLIEDTGGHTRQNLEIEVLKRGNSLRHVIEKWSGVNIKKPKPFKYHEFSLPPNTDHDWELWEVPVNVGRH